MSATTDAKQVLLRLTPEEFSGIRELADSESRSVNALVRSLIAAEIENRRGRPWPQIDNVLVSYAWHPEEGLDDEEFRHTVRKSIKAVITAHGGLGVRVADRWVKS